MGRGKMAASSISWTARCKISGKFLFFTALVVIFSIVYIVDHDGEYVVT